jgi:hypothetical protein
MNIGRSSTGAIRHYDAEEPDMTKIPTPATAGDARELTDEDLVSHLIAFADIPRRYRPYRAELLSRLHRATPAAEPGMVTISGLAARSIQYHLEQHGKRNAELDDAIAAADPAPGEGESSKEQLRKDVEALWPQMEAGMKYLSDK